MNQNQTQRMRRTVNGWVCDACGGAAIDWSHRCSSQVTRPKPEPAAGQVWRFGYRDLVIARVDGPKVSCTLSEHAWSHVGDIARNDEWVCVGIETPAGRVMVGERRRVWPSAVGDRREGEFLDFEVCHVMSDARVWIADGVEGWPETAAKVAAWQLVPGPLANAAESTVRKPWETIAEVRRMGHGLLQPEVMAEILGISLDAVAMPKPIPRMPMPECAHLFPPLPANPPTTGSQLHGAIRTIVGPDATIVMGGTSVDIVLRAGTSEEDKLEAFADVRRILTMMADLKVTIAAPPDPRIAREQRRREIDAVLYDDARRFPAFATARRRAIVAHVERNESTNSPHYVPTVLGWLHAYEKVRGGLSKPSAEAWRLAATLFGWDLADLYERARGMA